MKTRLATSIPGALALGLLIAAAPASLQAIVIAEDFGSYTPGATNSGGQTHFNGGSGAWLSAWRTAASTGVSNTATIADTAPLHSGGQYVSTAITTASGQTAVSAGSLSRAYDAPTVSANSTLAFTTSFDFRVDTTAAGLRYDIFDAERRTTGATASRTAWQISAYGGYWHVSDGSTTFTNTNLAFSAGVTYSFSITQDIATKTWDLAIAGDNDTSVTLSGLDFRLSDWITDPSEVANARWLVFTVSENGTASVPTVGLASTFSIDNIVISTIPEPSAAALVAGMGAIALAVCRRR